MSPSGGIGRDSLPLLRGKGVVVCLQRGSRDRKDEPTFSEGSKHEICLELNDQVLLMSSLKHKTPDYDCFSIIIETHVGSPCSNPATIKRTAERMEMQIRF